MQQFTNAFKILNSNVLNNFFYFSFSLHRSGP